MFDWLFLIGLGYLALIAAIAFFGVHVGELEKENRILREELATRCPEYAEAMGVVSDPD